MDYSTMILTVMLVFDILIVLSQYLVLNEKKQKAGCRCKCMHIIKTKNKEEEAKTKTALTSTLTESKPGANK